MSRRSRGSDPASTAWRIRAIAGPELALRYHEQATRVAAERAAPTDAEALPADPVAALFGELTRQFEKAAPTLGTPARSQLGDLMQATGRLVQARQGPRGLPQIGQQGLALADLVARAEQLLRGAAAGAATARAGRVRQHLLDLKLAVARQGLGPGSDAAGPGTATELFTRLARLCDRWAVADDAARAQLEHDEARLLADEVQGFLRAGHLLHVSPPWPTAAPGRDANAIFCSCGETVGTQVARAARPLGLRVEAAPCLGGDIDAQRWRSLRRCPVAVFDLGAASPQVHYELGLALVAGSQLLLLARHDTPLPFDVAQQVHRVADDAELARDLPALLDQACYGLQAEGGDTAARPAAIDWVALLRNGLPGFARVGSDTVRPRWRPPPPAAPGTGGRWFAVMPFRPAAMAQWQRMSERLRRVAPRLQQVRGDVAIGQHIIGSIWDELCLASHVTVDLSGLNPNVCIELGMAHALGKRTLLIGAAGTAAQLGARLPGAAQWRCHEYPTLATLEASDLEHALDRFVAGV